MIPILVELIYSQPPLISFKRDKSIGNFLIQKCIPNQWSTRNFKMHTRAMQRQRSECNQGSKVSLGSLLLMSHGASWLTLVPWTSKPAGTWIWNIMGASYEIYDVPWIFSTENLPRKMLVTLTKWTVPRVKRSFTTVKVAPCNCTY